MSKIVVNFISPSGHRFDDSDVDDGMTILEVINELVMHWGLPQVTERGKQVAYSLSCDNKGQNLSHGQTLASVGIATGDSLKLSASDEIPVVEVVPFPEEVTEPGRNSISVLLSVGDVNRAQPETLELDIPVQRLLVLIAKKYQLAMRDDNGDVVYLLKSKALHRILRPTETLRAANVPEHDRLSVVRDEVAG